MSKETGRRRKSKGEPEVRSRTPLWIGLGVGGAAVVAGIVTLVIVLNRPGVEKQVQPPISVIKPLPDEGPKPAPADQGNTDKPAPAPVEVKPPMPPPEALVLTDAEKKLRPLFNVRLLSFGPARFEHAQFKTKPWTGVIVEVEGLKPDAVGRFEAASVTCSRKAGVDVSAAIFFTAGGRDGLAANARILAGSVGKSGNIILGDNRFQPWPVGTLQETAVEANSPTDDTARVHLPSGNNEYKVGDFLVAMPLALEAGGGIEYGFVPGKKVQLGFLFPRGPQEELAKVKLLGHHLDLNPGKQGAPVVVAKGPGAPPMGVQPVAPPQPKDGTIALAEYGRIVTPIQDQLRKQIKDYFVPQRVAFAPEGNEFAGVGMARAAWRIGGGLLWGKDERAETVRYTADGSKIIVVGDSQFTIYERKTGGMSLSGTLGQPPKAPNFKPLNPLAPALMGKEVEIRDGAVVSPDGKIAYAPTAMTTPMPPRKESEFCVRVYDLPKRGLELRKFPVKHTGWITMLALSPDGKQLLTGSEDNTVRLWEAATGKELKVFQGHTARIVAVGWSADGKRIVSAAEDYDVNLLKQLIAQKKPTDPARKDGTARVWDVATGKEIFQVQSLVGLQYAFLSPDGRFLGVGRTIWEVGQEKPRYSCPPGGIDLLAFTPDGRTLIASAREGFQGANQPNAAIVLYRFPEAAAVNVAAPAKPAAEPMLPAFTEVPLKTLEALEMPAGDVRVLSDNKRAVSVGWDGMLRLWDLKEGKAIKAINVGAPLVRMAVRSDTSIAVATGVPFNAAGKQQGDNASVFYVNPESGQKTHPVKDLPPSIRWLAFSGDGTRLASSGATLNLWEASGKPFRAPLFPPLGELPHNGEIERVVFGPGAKRLITGGADNFIKYWDPATLRCTQTLAGHGGAVTALAISRDGKHLLSGSADHTLILWEQAKGQQVRTFTGHSGRVLTVAFLADGKRLASITDHGETILWNLTTGDALRRIRGTNELLRSAAISNDGRYVVWGTEEGPIKMAELPAE